MRGETGALPSGPVHTLFKRVMIALAPLLDRWWAGRMNFLSGLGCGHGQGLSIRSNKTWSPALTAELKSAAAIFSFKSALNCITTTQKNGFASALKGKSTDFTVMQNKEDRDESQCT